MPGGPPGCPLTQQGCLDEPRPQDTAPPQYVSRTDDAALLAIAGAAQRRRRDARVRPGRRSARPARRARRNRGRGAAPPRPAPRRGRRTRRAGGTAFQVRLDLPRLAGRQLAVEVVGDEPASVPAAHRRSFESAASLGSGRKCGDHRHAPATQPLLHRREPHPGPSQTSWDDTESPKPPTLCLRSLRGAVGAYPR
jgi:hypothetical protein